MQINVANYSLNFNNLRSNYLGYFADNHLIK